MLKTKVYEPSTDPNHPDFLPEIEIPINQMRDEWHSQRKSFLNTNDFTYLET